jgi:hypothetical protein
VGLNTLISNIKCLVLFKRSCAFPPVDGTSSAEQDFLCRSRCRGKALLLLLILLLLLLLLLLTAIGLSPGGSSPTLLQTKIKIHKTTTTTKQLQNIKKHKTTK